MGIPCWSFAPIMQNVKKKDLTPDLFDIFAQMGTEIVNVDPFQTMPDA